MVLLPVHSQNFSSLRKNSFKHACRRVTQSQAPVSYRGQPLTPQLLRRTGSCPPPTQDNRRHHPPSRRAGLHNRPIRALSWNAGHLGQQRWAEIKTWLAADAAQYCDVLILQETHWKASSEFTVSGLYYISSASEPAPATTRLRV